MAINRRGSSPRRMSGPSGMFVVELIAVVFEAIKVRLSKASSTVSMSRSCSLASISSSSCREHVFGEVT